MAGVADAVRLDQVLGDVAGRRPAPWASRQALAERDGLGNRGFMARSLHPAQPAPVRDAHQQHEQVAHDGRSTMPTLANCLAVKVSVPRATVFCSVDRQDETVAHHEAGSMVMPRRLKSPGSVCSTAMRMGSIAEVSAVALAKPRWMRIEGRQDGEDAERAEMVQAGMRHDLGAQPLAGLGGQQGRAQADAHAEHDHRAPRNARLHVFPGHDAKARQHQQHQAEVGGGGRSNLAATCPSVDQNSSSMIETSIRRFAPRSWGRVRAARLRRPPLPPAMASLSGGSSLEHHEDQHRGHQQRPGHAGDQPVGPRHAFAQHLVHEADGQQVLRGGGLDADVPDAGGLGHDDHDAGGDVGALVHAEGAAITPSMMGTMARYARWRWARPG